MKKGMGKFLVGACVGAGLGLLFAPKSGSETRKELKKKLDELLEQAKNIDVNEVRKDFSSKIEAIKVDLADLDREKVLEIAKEKGLQAKKKAQDLVELAQEKGTPLLKNTAESVLENVIKVSKETLKKLESEK